MPQPELKEKMPSSLSSNIENEAPLAKPQRKLSAVAFANPWATRTKSATSIYGSPPCSSAIVDGGETGESDKSRLRILTRTRSEDVGPRVREEWGNELQPGLRESASLLHASVDDYNKVATDKQWRDLLQINTDLTELGKLADGARKRAPKKGADDDDDVDGLSKFSTVALEYSKMLDVVMNQCPEYAGLAWGAIRMLLVAHTNHSKLKHAVEHYIIHFGHDFGVVNHLMNSHPTQKMVEAVTEAYTAFAKFLAKAVKYYKESKLMSAIKAFGFPWETRFEVLVKKIEAAFRRIKDIASAGHFGITVQTHQMIETIGTGQETIRHEMRHNTLQLREQLKLEMRDEVQSLFESFDRNWITRFEQILVQSIRSDSAIEDSSKVKMVLPGPKAVAIQYAESMTELDKKPSPDTFASYLSDYVSKPKRLKRFRDKSFFLLQKLDNDVANTNIRLRHTTTQDLQQIMDLLRHGKMRVWLQASTSSLIWVNTFKRAGPSDWTTVFSLRITEYASKVKEMTVLYYLCGNHSTSSEVSSPTVLLQALIMQLIQQHHKRFVRQVFPFTLEHFKDVQDDIHDLWDLFVKCYAEVEIPCLWLILDHLDNLQKGDDYDFLLQALLHGAQQESPVLKVFISARTGTPAAISEMLDKESSNPWLSTITVPRPQSIVGAAIFSRQKRRARQPEPCPDENVTAASRAEIDALLNSSSEDDLQSENEAQYPPHPVRPPASISVLHDPRLLTLKREDSDLESSDASMEFTRDDPFATSDEDLSDDAVAGQLHKDDSSSDKEGFSCPEGSKPHKEKGLDSDPSEEELEKAIKSDSRGRKGPLQQSVRITESKNKGPFDSSESEESGRD